MTALPADIARFTANGTVVTAEDAAIKTNFSDARDMGETELEMFCDDPDDAQILLNERFAIAAQVAPLHMAIELDETLRLGTAIPIAPETPLIRVIDVENDIDETLRLISYAHQMASDTFSIEVHK